MSYHCIQVCYIWKYMQKHNINCAKITVYDFLKIDSKGVINSTCNTIKVIKMSSSTSYDMLLPCKLHW